MNKSPLLVVAVMALLVTGCPRNKYVVELVPRGDVIERTLVFHREDGTNSEGAPNYQKFPADELAAINALYPASGITNDGWRHVARGEFGVNQPHDVGGAGTYSNFATSLGSAGMYSERFRGDDDLATRTARRLKAADGLVDHIVNWSHDELGREAHYRDLRHFLDVDFRRDVKNLG